MTTEQEREAQHDLKEIEAKHDAELKLDGSAMLGAYLISMLTEKPNVRIDEKAIEAAHEQVRSMLRLPR